MILILDHVDWWNQFMLVYFILNALKITAHINAIKTDTDVCTPDFDLVIRMFHVKMMNDSQ